MILFYSQSLMAKSCFTVWHTCLYSRVSGAYDHKIH